MGKMKEKYADEIIHELEKIKHGAWVDWIDKCSKDAVIEICQNVIEDWCGRSIDHVQPCPKEPKEQQTVGEWLSNPLADDAGEGYFICSKCKSDVWDVTDYCPELWGKDGK